MPIAIICIRNMGTEGKDTRKLLVFENDCLEQWLERHGEIVAKFSTFETILALNAVLWI